MARIKIIEVYLPRIERTNFYGVPTTHQRMPADFAGVKIAFNIPPIASKTCQNP